MIKALFTFANTATLGLLLSFSSLAQAADTFEFSSKSDAHNMLMFQIDHLGFSRSIGFFQDFEGTIQLDQENLENSTVEANIDINSLDIAAHEEWNQHTKKYFFQNGAMPEMTFKSTKVEDLGDGKLAVTGDLTLMGVTKSLILNATLNKVGDFMDKGIKAGFSATTRLSRKDFGITAIPFIGDQVQITIEIEASKQVAEEE